MNGLSVSELCCFFCYSHYPSQIVAFFPPLPKYKLVINEDQTTSPNQVDTAVQTNTTFSRCMVCAHRYDVPNQTQPPVKHL